MKILY